MADIKILMMGGRRSGKSSILASMIHQLSNNVDLCTKYIQITPYGGEDGTAIPLEEKRNNLVSFIEKKPTGSHYLVDFNPDDKFNKYYFKAKIPKPEGGTYRGNVKIEIVDCPGECFDTPKAKDNVHAEFDAKIAELSKHAQQSDIFLIIVDTPYLMDSKSDSGKFMTVNRPDSIKKFIQENVAFARNDDYKKVIFVPVKCEKWRNNLDEVSKKLQEPNYFGNLMDFLDADQRWSYSVIPALTAGSIEFSEFGDPFLTKLAQEKCSQLGNSPLYRMADGSIKTLKKEEVIVDGEHKVLFPYYSWFVNKDKKYEPENCDQIGLHVWRFVVYKTKINREHSSFPAWLTGFPTISRLEELVRNMEQGGLLKDTEKGIVNIRKIETT
mgnify:CR=1 FL=1|jgi:hypothetical protein